MWYGLQCRVVKSQKNNWNFVGHKNLNQKIVQSQNCLGFLKCFCDCTIFWLGDCAVTKNYIKILWDHKNLNDCQNRPWYGASPHGGNSRQFFPRHFWFAMTFSKVSMLLETALFLSRLRDSPHVLRFHWDELKLENLSTRSKLLSTKSSNNPPIIKQNLKQPTTIRRSCLWPSTKPVKHSTSTCTNRENASTRTWTNKQTNKGTIQEGCAASKCGIRKPCKVHCCSTVLTIGRLDPHYSQWLKQKTATSNNQQRQPCCAPACEALHKHLPQSKKCVYQGHEPTQKGNIQEWCTAS